MTDAATNDGIRSYALVSHTLLAFRVKGRKVTHLPTWDANPTEVLEDGVSYHTSAGQILASIHVQAMDQGHHCPLRVPKPNRR